MNEAFWARALLVSSSVGYAFAFAARYLPFLKNTLAPRFGFVTILLTNMAMLWQKFVENANVAALYVSEPHPQFGEASVALAGIGGILGSILKPVLIVAQPALISLAQYWLNKFLHEGPGKTVAKGT